MSEFRRISVLDSRTTTASPFNRTITEIEDDTAVVMFLWVVAKQESSANSHMWLVGNAFVQNSGTLTEVGATSRLYDVNSGLAGVSIDVDVTSSTYIQIIYNGLAGTNINWSTHGMALVLKLT